MKEPTAPRIYPELPVEDGQNYRLQKISDVEKLLEKEKDTRKALYKRYKRLINATDGADTALVSASAIMAGLGIIIPFALLPLEIAAMVSGCLGLCVKLVRRKLMSKTQKHHQIRTIAESKLNSIRDLISKALSDGEISGDEFRVVLCELQKYNDLKDQAHVKQSGLSDQEKKELIEKGKALALDSIKKNITVT